VKIEAWFIGKTSPAYLQIGLDDFAGRIKKYVPFETVIIADIKEAGSYAAKDRLLKEGEKVFQKLNPQDYYNKIATFDVAILLSKITLDKTILSI
jgi:23S rRNA (pseudouridine1915-N3)-methyltransferase